MPNDFGRKNRVSKEIQRELAPLLAAAAAELQGVMVSITGVEIASDLRNAVVFISCYGPGAETALKFLPTQTARLRQQLAARMRIKSVPNLKLVADESIERGARISALINSLEGEDGIGKK